MLNRYLDPITYSIHVSHIYLHLADFIIVHVGKHTSYMDPMGVSKLRPVSVGLWGLDGLMWRYHIGVLQLSQ